MKKRLQLGLYFIVFTLLFISSIVFRNKLSLGVSFGIRYSLNVLIPSLFPLIFLSSLLSVSPLSGGFSKLFSPLTRQLFKLPGNCFLPIFMGLTCGYPVGAKLTAALFRDKKINAEEAGQLLLFVMNPGIPFSVLFVGGVLFRDLSLGFRIFGATCGASLLLGILSGIRKPVPQKRDFSDSGLPLLQAVNTAAKSALGATSTMCLYLVIFSAYLPLLHSWGVFQELVRHLASPLFTQPEVATILSFLGEVVQGTNDGVRLKVSAEIFALGLSFGGVCIHFQIFSFFEKPPIPLRKFYFGRLIHGIFTYGIFSLAQHFSPRSTAVFSSLSSVAPAFSRGTVTGSICLILLVGTYIFLTNENGVEKRRLS